MKVTADHGEIQRWVEERGGCPAVLPAGDGRNRLAIAFNPAECEPLTWEEFFTRFEREGLAFVYDPDANGDGAHTAKLVSR